MENNRSLKVIDKIIKNKLGYCIFKKLVRIIYFFYGLKVLSRALNTQKQPKPKVPQSVENFEDLSWLFFSNFLNRGIIKMDIDEAASLFKTIRQNQPRYIIEIGRDQGGSTMLMSAAKGKNSKLISLDLEDKCHQAVKKLIDHNTILAIANSRTFIPEQKVDFLLIDGDNSLEGVRADFEHFLPYLDNNADILFHDAVGAEKGIFVAPPVNFFVKTLVKHPKLIFIKDVGSTRYFKKI